MNKEIKHSFDNIKMQLCILYRTLDDMTDKIQKLQKVVDKEISSYEEDI